MLLSNPVVVGVLAFMAGLMIGLVVGGLMGGAKRADLQMDVLRLRRERMWAVERAQAAERIARGGRPSLS
jgi:hypothetical protein